MSTRGSPYTIEVWGEFACFTSPMKVERWSYPFITPSAARGIFDAIFVNWHEFRWQVDKIELLSEPQYIALMRNEVKDKGPSDREIIRWMGDIKKVRPIIADGDKASLGTDQRGRTQRQTMALRDVRYRLTAHIVPWPNAPKNIQCYESQFQRRLERGQNFTQPCFGCREFPAWWSPRISTEPRWEHDVDAGWMLYDVFDLSRPGETTDKVHVSVFRAKVVQGVLEVPPYESDFVRKGVSA
jgi:CRISPR-associated protein Cas5d